MSMKKRKERKKEKSGRILRSTSYLSGQASPRPSLLSHPRPSLPSTWPINHFDLNIPRSPQKRSPSRQPVLYPLSSLPLLYPPAKRSSDFVWFSDVASPVLGSSSSPSSPPSPSLASSPANVCHVCHVALPLAASGQPVLLYPHLNNNQPLRID